MIKDYSNDDFHNCCELFVQVFNAPPWNDNWTMEIACKYLCEITRHQRFIGYTLWESGVLIGVVFCRVETHFSVDIMFVEELFVSVDCQRKGYGTVLMKEVEKYASENSVARVTLLTSRGTPPFKFYEKIGYEHLDWLAFLQKSIL